jgi:hypothetical protein
VRDGHVDGMEVSLPQPGSRSVTFNLSTSTNDKVTLLRSAYANKLSLRELRVVAASGSRGPPAIPPYGHRKFVAAALLMIQMNPRSTSRCS